MILQHEFDRLERLIRKKSKVNAQTDEQKLQALIKTINFGGNVIQGGNLPPINTQPLNVPTEYYVSDGTTIEITTLNNFITQTTIVTLNGIEQIRNDAYTEINTNLIRFCEVIPLGFSIGIRYIKR